MAITPADAEAGESDLRSFRLVFEAATCDDCGETVPVTSPCKCGAWVPRDDEHVARRRASVADVRPILDTPITPTTPIDFREVIDALSPWIAGLFDGLNQLGEDSADSSGVRAHVGALAALRAQIAANPRRRPWLALWDPLAALVAQLAELAAAELNAAIAPDPEAAQAFEAIGQRTSTRLQGRSEWSTPVSIGGVSKGPSGCPTQPLPPHPSPTTRPGRRI